MVQSYSQTRGPKTARPEDFNEPGYQSSAGDQSPTDRPSPGRAAMPTTLVRIITMTLHV